MNDAALYLNTLVDNNEEGHSLTWKAPDIAWVLKPPSLDDFATQGLSGIQEEDLGFSCRTPAVITVGTKKRIKKKRPAVAGDGMPAPIRHRPAAAEVVADDLLIEVADEVAVDDLPTEVRLRPASADGGFAGAPAQAMEAGAPHGAVCGAVHGAVRGPRGGATLPASFDASKLGCKKCRYMAHGCGKCRGKTRSEGDI